MDDETKCDAGDVVKSCRFFCCVCFGLCNTKAVSILASQADTTLSAETEYKTSKKK